MRRSPRPTACAAPTTAFGRTAIRCISPGAARRRAKRAYSITTASRTGDALLEDGLFLLVQRARESASAHQLARRGFVLDQVEKRDRDVVAELLRKRRLRIGFDVG